MEVFYDTLVTEFKTNKNKETIVALLIDYCRGATPEDVYKLKVKMEIQFALEVNCNYKPLRTTEDYGCDLREILFNRNNQLIGRGQELLDIFAEKKMPDMWHILTDIDDTLYPNVETILGFETYIAGSDKSWMQKNPYPGIIEFYKIFYEHLPEDSRYTTILSATPGFLKPSKIADKHHLLHDVLGSYGFIQGPESKTQLSSHVGDLARNCVGQNCPAFMKPYVMSPELSSLFTLFGNTKFQRFTQYLQIFPEYNLLFIGDNGQGDLLAGKQMIEYCMENGIPNRIHVFIHKVSEDGRTFKVSPEEDPSKSIEGLFFFTTYAELANTFMNLDIFNQDDVQKIDDTYSKQIRDSKFKIPGTMPSVAPGLSVPNMTNTFSLLARGGKYKTKKYKYKKSSKTKKHKKHKKTRKNKKCKK
jgi:hypothetical protein